MHDGSVEPGFGTTVRRVDVLAESALAPAAVRRKAAVPADAESRVCGGRQLSAEQRLLEQAWEDYYSI